MPPLGSNLDTVIDAGSTDLSSLLNVLEWLKNTGFLGKPRVKVDLVRKLRSEVRNTWAHAPQQELTDVKKDEAFSIAFDFLDDLEKVFPNAENTTCLEHLKHLKINNVTNVAECELQSLLLQLQLLDGIKEEITAIKDEQSVDKSAIKESQQKLMKLQNALSECSQRMADFKIFRENINKQFSSLDKKLQTFQSIPEDICKIRENIEKICSHLEKTKQRQIDEREPTSCLPDKVPLFTSRQKEIQKVITLLEEEKAVVSLHGGPGFGKTAIAIEVSHKLRDDHNIPVVFSQLTTSTNVDEMVREMCRDVGINHDDKPKSSLILWLRNIKSKIIFVMDDIDNLLVDKTSLYEFVRLLRKNSNRLCQIVTTSRTSFKIPELSTEEVPVEEMDDEACVELLNTKCAEQGNDFLHELANLCGKIPLAMCIAGSRVDDFEDPNELLRHLKQEPMKFLKSPKSDQYVYQAISMSYKRCTDEEKESFVRLAVFDGSFSEKAACAVMKKDVFTQDILEKLVRHSLIKQPSKHRYSIHLLIKHFLKEQVTSEDETAQRAREEMMRAQRLMVEYFLNLGHELTMKSYSKDGYKENREALKQEAHNIQNVLKICCQLQDTKISDCLTQSEIYNTSARVFSLFVRTIIPGSLVDQFLQSCAKLAKDRRQHGIKINFDRLLADQERSKTIGKPDALYISKMKEIENEFKMYSEEIKEDKSLCAHYFYQYGRYLSRQSEHHDGGECLTTLIKAREQLEESLELRKKLTNAATGKADIVYSLLRLGEMCKFIYTSAQHAREKNESENLSKRAEEYYGEAITFSNEHLGAHELTASCYKQLGDYFLKHNDNLTAEEHYITAKKMRENLNLDGSERHVSLLNNLGKCLVKNKRVDEGIEVLEKARDMAEKLSESDGLNECKAKVYTSLAIAHHSLRRSSEDAVKYAKKAKEFDGLKDVAKKYEYNRVQKILSSTLGS